MSAGGSLRILHVDDDPDLAELTANMLERERSRFDVETATSVSDGLDRLDDTDYDCVVSDYDMPERNGIDFLDTFREEYPDLPFILYTGKGSEEIASEAISAGVTDYLQKETGNSQYTVLANRISNAVEKYRTQAELAQREQRFELFFEQSPLGVIEWDENFDIVQVNDAAEEILGHDETYLTGRSWEVIVPESERDGVGDVVGDLLANKGGYRYVNENIRKDGEHIVCEWHNGVVTDDDGDVVAIFSQFQDITERKEQQQQRQRLNQVLKTVPACVAQLNPDGEFVFANDRAEEVLGLEPTDVTERGYNDPEWNIRDLDGEPIPDEELPFRQVLDSGEPLYDFRHMIEWPDGSQKLLLVNGAPLFGENGTVENVIFALADVTDRVVREKRLEAILANTTAPLFMKDRDGEYLLVNRGWRELFELEDAAVQGKTDAELFSEEMASEVRHNDRRVLETGDHVEEEERIIVDGDERTFLTSKTPVYDIGTESDPEQPVAMFGVANEITAQKERERRLARQNDQFDELASVISHDLQTPLETARGRAELAVETGDTEQMERALSAIERTDELRENLVEVLQTREIVDETKPVDIKAVGRAAWNTVASTDDSSLQVKESFRVAADPDALKRLLENLFSNAIEHGDGPMVRLGQTDGGFFVADDGPGIPEDERDDVLTPGYSTNGTGSGLGLPSVRQIATAHGWGVDIAESRDGGARLELTDVAFPE